jgi:hypothetical protein
MDAKFAQFDIVRSADYRAFLRKETKLRNMELAIHICDDSAREFDGRIGQTLMFKQVRKLAPGTRGSAVVFAADFGKQIVDHHAKAAPAMPAQKRLQNRGFHSLKYAVSGIEHFVLLDADRAIPVYAVTFQNA